MEAGRENGGRQNIEKGETPQLWAAAAEGGVTGEESTTKIADTGETDDFGLSYSTTWSGHSFSSEIK